MKRMLLVAAVLAFLVIAGPASAAVFIDFTTGTAGNFGTITYNGTNATGSVGVGTLTVSGDGGYNGTYDTSGTAPDTFGFANANNGSAVLNFDTAAKTISVVGDVCPLGQAECGTLGNPTAPMVPNTTLLSGTFDSFSISASNIFFNLTGTGPDTKSPLLLTALGLPTDTKFVFFALNIAGTGTNTGVASAASPFTYTGNSSDIENMAVPEPASILLLGTVLVGITHLLRRRTRKA